MLRCFFEIGADEALFEGLYISRKQELCEQYMGKFPVVFLSLKNVDGLTFENARYQLTELVGREASRFLFLLESDRLTETDKDIYRTLISVENGRYSMDENILSSALQILSQLLHKHYGQKTIILIDEYDVPLDKAFQHGYYKEMVLMIRGVFGQALKTNDSLYFAVLTGCLRVSKESIFTGLNNFKVLSITDHRFDEHFGFTDDEVCRLLTAYGMEDHLSETKEWYDGYHFGEHDIYNPWSILNYASRKVLEPYWVNTSSNTMIKKAISSSDEAFERGYEELIRNGKLETTVKMDTSFFEVNNTENLWGLLVNAGYLTLHKTISIQDSLYIIKIPNQEVQLEFRKLTAYHLKATETDLTVLFNSLKRCKKEDFEDRYRKILLTLPSYHDLKDENSYHMMLLGMCAWLSNEYEVISNREVGKGRCDIILKSKKNQISYILEFKYTNDSSVDLKQLAKSAIDQINSRRYDSELSGTVIRIGLAHYQKNVEIEWQ